MGNASQLTRGKLNPIVSRHRFLSEGGDHADVLPFFRSLGVSVPMFNLLVVGLGGFLGSILRYLTGLLVMQASRQGAFPWATVTVNVLGCLIIGLLGRWFESADQVPSQLRLFLMVGLLGGFTTFSAFGYETLLLLRDRQLGLALINVLAQLTLGLAAVWTGYQLGSRS